LNFRGPAVARAAAGLLDWYLIVTARIYFSPSALISHA